MFLSTLPSIHHAGGGGVVSPLSAKLGLKRHISALTSMVHLHRRQQPPIEDEPPPIPDAMRTVAKKPHHARKRQKKDAPIPQYGTVRERATAALLAKVPVNGLNKDRTVRENFGNNLRAIRAMHRNNVADDDQSLLESRQQSTLDALGTSQAYVQTIADASPPAGDTPAFAAEQWLSKRDSMHDDDDSLDTYYAMDDDRLRGKFDDNQFCSTPTFYRLYRPTCNEVHSTVSGPSWLTGEEYISKDRRSRFLGAGAYRQVFLLEKQFTSSSDEVIFKSMKRLPPGKRSLEERAAYNPDEVYKQIELYDDMRKDSMVMELLTSSPRIADIYSFCGLSSIIEYAPGNLEDYVLPTNGEKEGDDDDDPTPVNNHIEPLEKLEMALELAKGLASMHGHSDGVIANVDVQIGQFCRGTDGLIKVLDFNRAEVMMYDETREEYCKFSNGPPPDGSFRAPEEIIDAPLSEKIDVYTLGNVFYSLLTGLLVNREYSIKESHWRITHGETEEIDVGYFESRSPPEMALVKAIQWCWTFEAEERPSIFDIVEFLAEEVRKNLGDQDDSSPSRSRSE
ncbi:hypothetical protein ACHAXT_000609 [Thalassiosira profunda]